MLATNITRFLRWFQLILANSEGILSWNGFNLRRVAKFLLVLPRFARDYNRYLARGGSVNSVLPIYDEDAGEAFSLNDYMILDYLAISELKKHLPSHHVDIGSRIDGFVLGASHLCRVSSIDVRPNATLAFFGVNSVTGDACGKSLFEDSCSNGEVLSLSSIHAIEHFGLGRYGDDVNPYAIDSFLRNAYTLLGLNGLFYLGFPCGPSQVVFNAHRLMRPSFYLAKVSLLFKIDRIYLVNHGSSAHSLPWRIIEDPDVDNLYEYDDDTVTACLLILRKII